MAYDKERVVYEVTAKDKLHKWTVRMFQRTCSWRKWGLLHFPCRHAMTVCKYERVDYYDYMAHEYMLQAYHATWLYNFNPFYHEDLWRDNVGPVHVPNPKFKRNKVGRNPSRRRRNEMDQRHFSESSSDGASSTVNRQDPSIAPSAMKLDITGVRAQLEILAKLSFNALSFG
ncbi:hypothetical protein QQ045_012878 [Rhodiola kirilowii]